MKPDREGIWEWFTKKGVKKLVYVCDINTELRKATGNADPCLVVYWWGGYYHINDEHDPDHPEWDERLKAEWDDNWGARVGDLNSISDDLLYLGPTPEERKIIMENQ